MIQSIDTNILLYSLNADCEEHRTAKAVVEELAASDSMVILDLVLVELYLLLRNPAVLERPLDAPDAHRICTGFRRHPTWRVAENAPVMADVWTRASDMGFPRRRIIDARLALTALHYGVQEWITRNVNDFRGFGFECVTNPLQ